MPSAPWIEVQRDNQQAWLCSVACLSAREGEERQSCIAVRFEYIYAGPSTVGAGQLWEATPSPAIEASGATHLRDR